MCCATRQVCFSPFDANRALIYAAAMNAYKRERKASYELAAEDF